MEFVRILLSLMTTQCQNVSALQISSQPDQQRLRRHVWENKKQPKPQQCTDGKSKWTQWGCKRAKEFSASISSECLSKPWEGMHLSRFRKTSLFMIRWFHELNNCSQDRRTYHEIPMKETYETYESPMSIQRNSHTLRPIELIWAWTAWTACRP